MTTLNPDRSVNIAPMGPSVEPGWAGLELRPYPTSQTCRNLMRHPDGVFHVVDDVLLLARATIHQFDQPPATFPAKAVEGYVLADACRWYEFRVVGTDDSASRVCLKTQVVHAGRLRDFFGFNRAKHAVVEAAILASRVDRREQAELHDAFQRLAVLIEKTGGAAEAEAFDLLERYVATHR